jgi:outer membrane protein assembly factor BamB
MLFFSPIGKETTTIALDKNTGELIWKSKSIGDSLAYVSPILVNYNHLDIIINVGANYLFGVNAANGDILWKYKYLELNPPKEWWAPSINCTTPLYEDGNIYINSGYNHVGAMFKMNENASEVELVWVDSLIDTHHGGVVKLGDYIYGSNWINNAKGNWCCISWKTGEAKYEAEWKLKVQ